MSTHVSTDRMNDALDGLLSASELEHLERHVDGCAECRDAYARLSETVQAIRALSRSAETPEGVWQGIAARIEGRDQESAESSAEVVALPTRHSGPRRFVFTVPQLAAAAVVVSVLSAGTVWMAMSGGHTAPVPVAGSLDGPAARAVSAASATTRYQEVVIQLETILAEGRAALAPETLEIVDESLATVNAAIAEVEAALADDPGSELLARMLAAHQRTKLGVLQRAADAVRART